MNIHDYINKDFKPLRLNDKIKKVQKLFDETNFSHFPVVDKNNFYGLIDRQFVEYIDFGEKKIGELKNDLRIFYVSESLSWFEIFQYFATFNTNILPVLNEKKSYIGYFELGDFLNIFKHTPFVNEEGVVLVIAKKINDYSFSEITQIIESNNANLFGAFISKIENEEIQITLKLSIHDINNTLNSFRRYNYQIVNDFEKDKYLEELNDRSKYLQKYLNI